MRNDPNILRLGQGDVTRNKEHDANELRGDWVSRRTFEGLV